jgi:hypothetical protein
MSNEEILKQLVNSYEQRIKVLEDKFNLKIKAKNEQIKILRSEINFLRQLHITKAENARINNLIQNQSTSQSNMSEASNYNLNNSKFGGGFSGDQGTTVGGTLNDYSSNIDYSSKQNLSEAASEIQQLLTQLQTQGYSQEQAQQQTAQDLAKKAENNPTVLGKLVKWGQSLGNTAANTTVTEAAKEVFKIALRLSGIPIPY